MSKFTTHTLETAPERARAILEGAKKAYGRIPNLLGKMAEAPALLDGYTAIGKIFDSTSFTPTERQIVLVAASRFNECDYCIAAHSVIASSQGVPKEVIDAIRDDRPIADSRLEALRRFTTQVVEQRGHLSEEQVRSFLDAGFVQAQILEVVLGVGMKILSNYTNHIAETELDAAFSARAWKKAA